MTDYDSVVQTDLFRFISNKSPNQHTNTKCIVLKYFCIALLFVLHLNRPELSIGVNSHL